MATEPALPVTVCGRPFSADDLEAIGAIIADDSSPCCAEIARRVCRGTESHTTPPLSGGWVSHNMAGAAWVPRVPRPSTFLRSQQTEVAVGVRGPRSSAPGSAELVTRLEMSKNGAMKSRWPILALLCVLASLLVPGTASAHSAAGAENRVWASDLAEQVHVAGQHALTLDLHQGYELAEYDSASGSLLAPRGGARAVDPNKLHHIFGQARHNLDDVVKAAGSREAAFDALQKGAQSAVDAGKLTGRFETVVNVGGFDVTVRGAVVDGVARIGTAFR